MGRNGMAELVYKEQDSVGGPMRRAACRWCGVDRSANRSLMMPQLPRVSAKTFAPALLAMTVVGLPASSAAQQILETNSASLVTYLPGATGTHVQGILPRADQRGVGLDGTLRLAGGLPWALNGNPFESAWTGHDNRGALRLHTGTWAITDVDLALPSRGGPWSVGRSYNCRQDTGSAQTDSNGPQGYNWQQLACPEIVLYDASTDTEDTLYLVYGADRYIEFVRSETGGSVYKSKNGAAGIFQSKIVSGEPDTWEYTDQEGNKTVFFGFDTESAPAQGQVWKWIPPYDPSSSYAYVGHKTNATSAISSGFDGSGRMTTLYDTEDRRLSFSYSSLSIGGAVRLTQIKAETKSGATWSSPGTVATVAQVDYSYYDTTTDDNGNAGDLKLASTRNYLSDTTTPIYQTRTQYYRYYKGTYNATTNPGYDHQIKYIIEAEGARAYDWADDGTLNQSYTSSSVTNASIAPYASAYFKYDTSHRISQATFNGSYDQAGGLSGVCTIAYGAVSYSGTSGYDSDPASRTVLVMPNGGYVSQFFDETGQALGELTTPTDPIASSIKWWLGAERDANGCISLTYSQDCMATLNVLTGAATYKSSTGLAFLYERETTGNLTGFVKAGKPRKSGTGGSVFYERASTWTTFTLSVGSGTVVRPLVASITEFPSETTAGTGGNTTTLDWTAYSSSLTPQGLRITQPAVSTSNNGSGGNTKGYKHFTSEGLVDWQRDPSGVVSYREYTRGQVSKSIQDADTDLNSTGQDFQGVTPPSLPSESTGSFSTSGGAAELHKKTKLTYDEQGRQTLVEVSFRTGAPFATRPTYYTRLADHRTAVISYPDYSSSGPTWYGPARYAVINQAGKAVALGDIAFTGTTTTTAPGSQFSTTSSDPIAAISAGTVTHLKTRQHEETGTRVKEERNYFLVPSSGVGTDGTNYDPTSYAYDAEGHPWRVKDPTGTIDRTVYDVKGRVIERWIGTNDHSFDSGEATGTDNMFKVEELAFDDASTSDKRGLLDSKTTHVDSSSTHDRTTSYLYDVRGRLKVELPGAAPYIVRGLDNLGRLTSVGAYSSASGLDSSTDPTASSSSNRMALKEIAYDELGREWKHTRWKINASDGAKADSIEDTKWFDELGRTIKADGEALTKTHFDHLGRPTDLYVLAKDDDTVFSDVDDVAGDIVLQEIEKRYSSASGVLDFEVRIERDHADKGSGETTGDLDSNADGGTSDSYTLTGGDVHGRPQIVAYYYDALERNTDIVRYGTNGGSTFTRPGSAATRSSTILRVSKTYNDDGTLKAVEDEISKKTQWAYDAAGRVVSKIGNYDSSVASGQPSGTADNVTTRYEYVDGLQSTLTADLPSGKSDQVTTYYYGTTKGSGAGDSAIATNRLLQKIAAPDSSGSADVVKYAYNGIGQTTWKSDQATGSDSPNVLEFDYDANGRMTAARVATVGTGFDNSVRKIATTYDALGRSSLVTQYDAVSGGAVTDEVRITYDGWGNLLASEQDRNSAVGASGSVDDYEIGYAYEKKVTPGRNTTRRTSMTLPGGKVITYSYASRNGLYDNATSRVTDIKDSTLTLASYDYNGIGHVVGTSFPEPSVNSLVYGASNNYPDLDRFDRVVEDRWTKKLTSSTIDFYDLALSYDQASNVTTADDKVLEGFDVQYTLDGLHRLTEAKEGTLSSGTITPCSRDEQWTLGHTGAWDRNKVDRNGDLDFADTDDLDDTRTYSAANELQTRDPDSNTGTLNSIIVSHDAAGNLTDDGENYKFEYDAFYRLKRVKKRTSPYALVAEYRYNGLGHQIAEHTDRDGNLTVNSSDAWVYNAYDDQWRVVARFVGEGSNPTEAYVPECAGNSGRGQAAYRDLIVCRYRDPGADGTYDERVYYCQNWRADVSAIVGSDGTLKEWVKYSGYGVPYCLPVGDANSDGQTDGNDSAAIDDWITNSTYDVRGDVNLDGVVNETDKSLVDGDLAGLKGGRGVLSTDAVGNRVGYAGYQRFIAVAAAWQVRHRVLFSALGAWNRRDLVGVTRRTSRYQYAVSSPLTWVDPLGLSDTAPAPTVGGSVTGDDDGGFLDGLWGWAEEHPVWTGVILVGGGIITCGVLDEVVLGGALLDTAVEAGTSVLVGGAQVATGTQVGVATTGTIVIAGETPEGQVVVSEAEEGFIRLLSTVNQVGSSTNCGNCVIAAESTLAGYPACALPSLPVSPQVIEVEFCTEFEQVSGMCQIGSILSRLGDGARGIVAGFKVDEQVGHVWNVVNANGEIIFLDAQQGTSAVGYFEKYDEFQFLITNAP